MDTWTWRYTLTERDPDKPWLMLGWQDLTIELPREQPFHEWARTEYKAPQWIAEPMAGEESRWFREVHGHTSYGKPREEPA